MRSLCVRLTFTEDLLGTANSDPDIHEEFIASKAPDAPSREEEIAAIGKDEAIKKSKTIFHRDEHDNPILFNYMFKGHFKDACGMLARLTGTKSKELKAYKKIIDGLIFVYPRKVLIHFDGQIGSNQRPLRASTPQGERIALVNSETIPAGAYVDIEIQCLCDDHCNVVEEWLNYGSLRGIGQWRNAGYGSYTWEKLSQWQGAAI